MSKHTTKQPILRTLALGCSMACASLASAQGSPWVHLDGTTHWYEAVATPAGITWDNANAAANAAGGYLVTITSSQENDFVFALVDDAKYWAQDDGPWIGGVQPPGSPEPGGGWMWAEYEPFSYQDWATGKPDDAGGADRLHFGGAIGRVKSWADAPASKLMMGYVIERSGPTVPRTVGLQQRDAGSFDGYTLFAPINSGTTYLVDPRGRIVHSWTSSFGPGLSAYLLPNGNLLRTGRVGNPAFTIGGSGGIVEEYDWQGNLVWSFLYSSSTFCQHHDVQRLPNGNTLLIAWELKTQQEAIAAGRDPSLLTSGALFPGTIIEVQPTGPSSGQVVWEWHTFDHLIQDYDPLRANYGNVAQHPELVDFNYPPPGHTGSGINDWMHSNAVSYNAKLDQIILSARHFNEFWILDHSTTTAEAASHAGGRSGHGGDLLYRWGNPEAYRAGTANDRQLFEQHDAHWIDDALPGGGNFLVFDNGLERPTPFSTVVEVSPPTPDLNGNYPRTGPAWGPTQPTWVYQAANATSFYSQFVGGAERMPNGNTLICSGWQGHTFEVTSAGQTVWSYICPVTVNPLQQGDVVTNNQMFRSPRYAASYPAFTSRSLTPGEPIETQAQVLLADGSTVPRRAKIGTPVLLSVRSAADAGQLYVVGTSATAGMFPVDYRFLRVGFDDLLLTSMSNTVPSVFQGYFGLLDAQGRASAALAIPLLPSLAGIDLHSTFIVVDWIAPTAVSVLGNEVVIGIER